VIRITPLATGPSSTRLKLEGQLVGESVALLGTELERFSALGHAVSLDLSNVWFASLEAMELLREALSRGTLLVAASPLLASQLPSGAP